MKNVIYSNSYKATFAGKFMYVGHAPIYGDLGVGFGFY